MTAAALAKIQLDDKREIDLHANINVLLVDDDPRFLDTARNYLQKDLGCNVHAVRATEEAAQHLQQHSYHMIITDLIFDPPGTMQGDQFIAENIGIMGKAKVVALTGQAYYAFRTKPELAKLGVEVFDKGDRVFEEITNMTVDTIQEQREEVENRLQAAISSIVPGVGIEMRTKGNVSFEEGLAQPSTHFFSKRPQVAIEHLYNELEAALTSYLKVLPNTNQKSIVVGDHHLSLTELIQHIEEGTDLGLAQMDILIMQFKDILRLNKQ
ncbi:MAG TPA: response regulator [Pyrinomonadaceae bacterium]|nr:response regulator [Pyrinomonadaceae bacterium]